MVIATLALIVGIAALFERDSTRGAAFLALSAVYSDRAAKRMKEAP